MRIGVPTETKVDEHRVALTAAGVRELVRSGHEIIIEAGAGRGSRIDDEAYLAQGARISPDARGVFDAADLILKVKEPNADEVARLRADQTLFTYLHLAPDADLTAALVRSGAACIAYEMVQDHLGRLPLLAPMSEVAGKIAAQVGAALLLKPAGGPGLLPGGVPGVAPARVVVLGGGVVGSSAAHIAVGYGARVSILDRSLDCLRQLDAKFGGQVETLFATELALETLLADADVVIGAVLVQGARAPKLLTRDGLRLLKQGAILVDVSIDQGGCFETSRPTAHSDPTYDVDGVTHYCVTNMPGAVPATSTAALANATLPYVLRLANRGLAALLDDPGFLNGLNAISGQLTAAPVAQDQSCSYVPPRDAVLAALG
jgi:alanine dehydrogenase